MRYSRIDLVWIQGKLISINSSSGGANGSPLPFWESVAFVYIFLATRGLITPAATVTLFSLGALTSKQGSYTGDSTGLRVYATPLGDSSPVLLDFSPSLSNNVSPVSAKFLSCRLSVDPSSHDYWREAFPNKTMTYFNQVYFEPELRAYHASPDPNRHYSAEEIARANQVNDLHIAYSHLNDGALGVALDTGCLKTPLNCTSRDVAINRVLRLACPDCVGGKQQNPSYPPSTHQPADDVGNHIQLDIEQLPVPSADGGFTHQVMAVDEKSGTLTIIGATSKSGPDILRATLKFLNKDYVAFGHKVRHLSADAESVFESLIPEFGKVGFELTLVPPQQHAQRLERYQQTLLNRYIATLSNINFFFPLKYTLQLKQAVAFIMSLTPTSITDLSSPFELRTYHRHFQHKLDSKLHIGSTCFVQQGDNARRSKAATNGQTRQATPKSELGICMGPSRSTPGSYDFLLASGHIEPRRVITIVNVANPFGFPTRRVYETYIHNPAPPHRNVLEKFPTVTALPLPSMVPVPTVSPVLPSSAVLAPPVPAAIINPLAPEPTILEIVSVTGNNPKTAEYEVRWSDGDVLFHHYPDLKDTDVFTRFLQTTTAFTKTAKSTGTRHSTRLPPVATLNEVTPPFVSITAIESPLTGDASWTLVPPKRKVSFPFEPSLARGPRVSTLPTTLELLFDDSDNEDDTADTPSTDSFIATTSTIPIDDLEAYTPRVSAAAITATQDTLQFELEPEPLHPAMERLSVKKAMLLDSTATLAAIDKEMNKYFKDYDVVRLGEEVLYSAIPDTALKQYNRMFLSRHFNADGTLRKYSARCFTDGSRQPGNTHYETYAATCDQVDKLATLAAYQARSNATGIPLQLFSFDIPGFFLQGRLTPDNSPVDCYIHFAADIPHPCAGKWYLRRAGTYGSKNANAISDAEIDALYRATGFFPNPEQPRLYTKFLPSDPTISTTISMHVDDGLGFSLHQPFVDEIQSVLTARYGQLEWHNEATSNVGVVFSRSSDSTSVSQSGYLTRMLHDLGADNLPFVSLPSGPDFFDPPTDSTPIDKKYYQHLTGSLVHLLITHHDIRKEITYLSSRQAAPTQSDLNKMIHLLAYLNHHRDHSVRYSGTDYQVKIWCDSSYNTHKDTARSQAGHFITIGDTNGAVCSYSGILGSVTPPQGSCEAEYMIMPVAAKRALHLRRLLHAMGFAQVGPMVLHEDNQAAINLAKAPAISKNSQHIHVRYHLIRDLVKANIVTIHYVPTEHMIADLLTKPLPLKLYCYFRDKLLNVSSTPLVPYQSLYA